MQLLQLPPLSLYVHIPWCVRKCPYCDFNSHAIHGDVPENQYVSVLLEDLDADLHWVQDRQLSSIFIGGGTPSLFSGQSIGQLLEGISKRISCAEEIEITLEANPGTAEQRRFCDYRLAGCNRLSIGVQSFQDHLLPALGRIHDAQEAHSAIVMAKAAGFENFNLDLMHGLPQQSVKDAANDLSIAIDKDAPHISWYQLTIEPNTEFYSRPPKLPDEENLEQINQAGFALLKDASYSRYEVSAFAKPGHRSRHNLNYWQFGDYLGIGAGAHGKVTLPDEGRILRTQKTRRPTHYLERKSTFLSSIKDVDTTELPLEFFMNALRLTDGVPADWFTQRTGLPVDRIRGTLARLEQQGLIATVNDQHLVTTPLGMKYLNSLLEAF